MASQTLRLPPLPSIRDIIKLYRLRALKQLSQNFLFEQRLTDKIVRHAGKITGNEVCEVGPGPGSITRSILNKGPSKLILIEKDPRFTACLQMLAQASNCHVDLHIGDVLAFPMDNMFSEDRKKAWDDKPPGIRIIGNLPFNVSTPLIIKWMKAISERNSAWAYGRVPLTLTFQREVAERMVAEENSVMRCRLSIMCQNWCHVEHKFNISGKAFIPKPDVDVGVVHFVPRVKPIINLPFKMVEKVVGTIFRSRQKFSFRPAALLFPKSKRNLVEDLYHIAKLRQDIRPYQLSLVEFGQLCEAYKILCDNDPTLIDYSYCSYKEISPEEEFKGEDKEDDPDQLDMNKL